MPSIINSDNGAVSGSAGLKFSSADDGVLEIQSNGNTSVIVSESSMRVPVGTIAERPLVPQHGMIRYNTDLNEVEIYTAGGWQVITSGNLKLKLDFDETTTLDSRISFTRATNGTYFDSAGVLRTAGSGVARFDHRLENGSWVNKGLLIEEQRTNLSLRSEEIDNSYWSKTNTTVTSNQVASPDGTTTADFLRETTTNGTHYLNTDPSPSVNITSTSAIPTTISIFVKPNGRQHLRLGFEMTNSPFDQFWGDFDLTTNTFVLGNNSTSGVPLSASISDVGNGWYRLSVTGYTNRTSTLHILRLYVGSAWQVYTYAGDTSKGFYFWGAQVETGAFSTSYIKTTDATVTRNADVSSMTGTNFSSWYNQTEGTVLWQGDLVGVKVGSTRFYSVSDGTNNEYFQGNATNSSGNGFTWALFDGGALQAVLNTPDPAVAPSANTTYKHASAYKVNDFAASRDGGTVATDTSGTLPTVNKLSFGTDTNDAGGFLNGHIAKFYYWNTRRPNEILQILTE